MKEIGNSSQVPTQVYSPKTSQTLNRVSFTESNRNTSSRPETATQALPSQQRGVRTTTAAKLMNPVLSSDFGSDAGDKIDSLNQNQQTASFLMEEPKYQGHRAFGDQRPPMVVAADRNSSEADEFQIYNDYVRRMTERHQMIIESAKRERIQTALILKAEGRGDIIVEDHNNNQSTPYSAVIPPSQDIRLAREARDTRDELLVQQEMIGGPKIIGSLNEQKNKQNYDNQVFNSGTMDG